MDGGPATARRFLIPGRCTEVRAVRICIVMPPGEAYASPTRVDLIHRSRARDEPAESNDGDH
jgi:hypothetical protein